MASSPTSRATTVRRDQVESTLGRASRWVRAVVRSLRGRAASTGVRAPGRRAASLDDAWFGRWEQTCGVHGHHVVPRDVIR